jgi:hypothetical protein
MRRRYRADVHAGKFRARHGFATRTTTGSSRQNGSAICKRPGRKLVDHCQPTAGARAAALTATAGFTSDSARPSRGRHRCTFCSSAGATAPPSDRARGAVVRCRNLGGEKRLPAQLVARRVPPPGARHAAHASAPGAPARRRPLPGLPGPPGIAAGRRSRRHAPPRTRTRPGTRMPDGLRVKTPAAPPLRQRAGAASKVQRQRVGDVAPATKLSGEPARKECSRDGACVGKNRY